VAGDVLCGGVDVGRRIEKRRMVAKGLQECGGRLAGLFSLIFHMAVYVSFLDLG
jgi:hypothetical protein